jgi:hypothetical protein
MLVYRLLAKEFDDFVYVSYNDAYSFMKLKKQISFFFFFDDFLGRNFLETGLSMVSKIKPHKILLINKKSKINIHSRY